MGPSQGFSIVWEHAWHSRCTSVCPNTASTAEAARKREVMSKSLLSCGNPVFSTGNPGQGHKPRGHSRIRPTTDCQKPITCPCLLGCAQGLAQAQRDLWDFHTTQETTRLGKPWEVSMQKLSIYFLFKQQHSTSENETIIYKSNLAAKLQGGVIHASKFSLFIHSRHTYRLILLLLDFISIIRH